MSLNYLVLSAWVSQSFCQCYFCAGLFCCRLFLIVVVFVFQQKFPLSLIILILFNMKFAQTKNCKCKIKPNMTHLNKNVKTVLFCICIILCRWWCNIIFKFLYLFNLICEWMNEWMNEAHIYVYILLFLKHTLTFKCLRSESFLFLKEIILLLSIKLIKKTVNMFRILQNKKRVSTKILSSTTVFNIDNNYKYFLSSRMISEENWRPETITGINYIFKYIKIELN